MENENRQNRQQSHEGQEHGPVHQVQEREPHHRERLDQSQGHVLTAGQKSEWHAEHQKHHVPHERNITVFIDHKPYYINSPRITGADVRNLSNPIIGPDKDIFHVVAGKVGNVKMTDADVIEVNTHEANHGRHFVSISHSTDELARSAYFAYLNRGGRHGHDIEDWLEAEDKLKTQS